ncbi:MAG: metal ABC transporter substrate-binding protein, partial [Cyanobium sp.]
MTPIALAKSSRGRRRRTVAGAALGLMALLSGCGSPRPAAVIAGDGVLCDITRRLAGDGVTVECLLGPKDDPHRFQLSPAQTRALRQARLVLINGYGLTPALQRIPGAVPVAELAVPQSPVLAPEGHDAHHDHDSPPAEPAAPVENGHHHGGRDPHVWHDPRQVAAMVRLVSRELQALPSEDTRRNGAIQRRERHMLQALASLHSWNQRQFATLPSERGRRTLATGHRAFASLSRAYDLQELPVVDALSSSDTLRPQALRQVVERLRRDRIPSLFSEQWPASRAMSRISALSGVPLAPGALRPDGRNAVPGELGSDNGDVMGTLTDNTCLIVE